MTCGVPTRFLLALALGCLSCAAQSVISTVAGTGTASFSGDGNAATSAGLNQPVYVAIDLDGNLLIADQFNHRIRRVNAQGVISTIAGTGAAGFSGDGGLATSAQINQPTGLCVDAIGNIYVSEVGNARIRRIDRTGIISTFAGNGRAAYAGDGGPAASASLSIGIRCAADASGNLYIADQGAHRIRRVDPLGIINTVAGTGTRGFSGDGGLSTSANLDNPTAVAVDTSGNLYFSDQFNHRIRKIDTNGTITTIAGTGTAAYSGDGAAATSANLNFPGGLVADLNGDILFADDTNYRIRKITVATGVITTIAGNGTRGFSGDGGPATSAMMDGQFGVALDAAGNLYFADTLNNRVRRITNAGAAIPPNYIPTSFTNGASFVTGLTPGGIASIFGTQLSTNLRGIAGATQLPLPTRLAGVSVTVDGIPAPLFHIINIPRTEQINFQVPFEIAGKTTATVIVNNGRTAGPGVQAQVLAIQPAVFLIGVNGAIVHSGDGSLVSPSNPAAAGEVLLVFATGLGAVDPPGVTGAAVSGLQRTAVTPVVTIGGRTAPLQFSGLAPGFVGLYQLNIVVPGGVSGTVDLIVTAGGLDSPVAKIALR